jgi:predicted DNA-binding transcriptional regulator AlpA
MDPLLTSKEAAVLLSVSQATLSRWRTQQSGPPNVNLQGIPRYRREDLEKWVEGNLA